MFILTLSQQQLQQVLTSLRTDANRLYTLADKTRMHGSLLEGDQRVDLINLILEQVASQQTA